VDKDARQLGQALVQPLLNVLRDAVRFLDAGIAIQRHI